MTSLHAFPSITSQVSSPSQNRPLSVHVPSSRQSPPTVPGSGPPGHAGRMVRHKIPSTPLSVPQRDTPPQRVRSFDSLEFVQTCISDNLPKKNCGVIRGSRWFRSGTITFGFNSAMYNRKLSVIRTSIYRTCRARNATSTTKRGRKRRMLSASNTPQRTALKRPTAQQAPGA